jgi:hypothetical protein
VDVGGGEIAVPYCLAEEDDDTSYLKHIKKDASSILLLDFADRFHA